MSVLNQMRVLLKQAEEAYGDMDQIVNKMTTDGGHLTQLGKEFIMICKKHEVSQSTVARAIGITPASVGRRYRANGAINICVPANPGDPDFSDTIE